VAETSSHHMRSLTSKFELTQILHSDKVQYTKLIVFSPSGKKHSATYHAHSADYSHWSTCVFYGMVYTRVSFLSGTASNREALYVLYLFDKVKEAKAEHSQY
jgi:hypothetical protein